MPSRDTNRPAGTPCWGDYGAADLAASEALYGELFGWSCSVNTGGRVFDEPGSLVRTDGATDDLAAGQEGS